MKGNNCTLGSSGMSRTGPTFVHGMLTFETMGMDVFVGHTNNQVPRVSIWHCTTFRFLHIIAIILLVYFWSLHLVVE